MTERRLRVLALVPYPVGQAPGQRYRIEQWAPYLREEGIDVHFEPFAGAALSAALYRPGHYATKAWHMTLAWLRRARTAWQAASFDVVYLYREAALIGPAWLERLARRRNPRLVYDFDDAIWLPYVSPRNRYLSYLKAPGKTGAICRMAAAVTVGNETLADFARRYNPAVTVVPSTVSLREYRPRPHPPRAARRSSAGREATARPSTSGSSRARSRRSPAGGGSASSSSGWTTTASTGSTWSAGRGGPRPRSRICGRWTSGSCPSSTTPGRAASAR